MFTRKGKCQFYVREHALVRNEVIALKYKTNMMIAVRIPVFSFVLLGRDAIDYNLTAICMVKSTQNIKHGGFARARLTQDCYKLIVSEGGRNIIKGGLYEGACSIGFMNVF